VSKGQRKTLAGLLAITSACTLGLNSYAAGLKEGSRKVSLQAFLKEYAGNASEPEDSTTRYFSRAVNLRGSGDEQTIVYLTGRSWCGTGGCTTQSWIATVPRTQS
jgi:hypothetical protein